MLIPKFTRNFPSPGNGTIEFEEFCAMMTEYLRQPLTEEDIVGAFKIFDRDCDGCITKEELKTVLDSLSIPCDQKSVEGLLKAADANGDGSIDYKGENVKRFSHNDPHERNKNDFWSFYMNV